jgi:hypothetical protein
MACQAMLKTRQPAMPAPGRPGRVRRDTASGTVSAASGTVSSDVPGTPAVLSVPWWGMVSAAVAPVRRAGGPGGAVTGPGPGRTEGADTRSVRNERFYRTVVGACRYQGPHVSC